MNCEFHSWMVIGLHGCPLLLEHKMMWSLWDQNERVDGTVKRIRTLLGQDTNKHHHRHDLIMILLPPSITRTAAFLFLLFLFTFAFLLFLLFAATFLLFLLLLFTFAFLFLLLFTAAATTAPLSLNSTQTDVRWCEWRGWWQERRRSDMRCGGNIREWLVVT